MAVHAPQPANTCRHVQIPSTKKQCARATRTPCRCIPLSTFQEEKPVWQPFYAERGSVHMYSTLAARGMGPEPRRISAARGGEGRGVRRRGGEGWTPGEVGKQREGEGAENIDLITEQLRCVMFRQYSCS